MLGDTYEITVEDIEGALKKQNLTLQRGRRRPHQYRLGQALGQGQCALRQVLPGHRREGGANGWSPRIRCCSAPTTGRSRSRPIPTRTLSLPVHQIALVVNGVHLLENLKLDELASKGVSEFAFIMQPLKIQGGDRLDRRAGRAAVAPRSAPSPRPSRGEGWDEGLSNEHSR